MLDRQAFETCTQRRMQKAAANCCHTAVHRSRPKNIVGCPEPHRLLLQSGIGCQLRTYARLAIPGRRHDQHCSKFAGPSPLKVPLSKYRAGVDAGWHVAFKLAVIAVTLLHPLSLCVGA